MRALTGRINWVGVRSGGLLLTGALLLAPGAGSAAAAVVRVVPVRPAAVAPVKFTKPEEAKGGFTVPAVEDEILDALEDFKRHVKNRAWEKAFHSMSELAKAKPGQMLSGDDGVILPASEVASRTLAQLPPEGREAYRIFYDPKARQLMEEARKQGGTPAAELEAAERVFEEYFLTSEGDQAADLLGDAAFQRGEFLRADRYWSAILEQHPDTDLPEAKLIAKRATALQRAGDHEGVKALVGRAAGGYRDAEVVLGGQSVRLMDYLEGLRRPGEEPAAGEETELVRDGYVPGLKGAPAPETKPEWQFVLMPEFLRKAATPRNSYSRGKSIETLVPSVASDGERLYGNWLGVVFALDLEGGKLLWWTESFSKLSRYFNQMYRIDSDRYTISTANGVVAIVALDPERINYSREPYRLRVFDAADGKLKWETARGNSNTSRSYAGTPIFGSNEVLVASHVVNGSAFDLQSLNLSDGKENWKVSLGTSQTSYESWSGYQISPTPAIAEHKGMVYFLANNGALLAVDLKRREVEWAVKYPPPVGTGERNYYSYNQPAPMHELLHVVPRLHIEGTHLYFNEARGLRLYRVNIANRTLDWRRPVNENAVLAGVDAGSVYMLSDELVAYDRETLGLRWATKIPMSAGSSTALIGERTVLVFSRRGIYELSKEDGDVEQIFRSGELESFGGALLVVGDRLICVSERAITAYPLKPRQVARDGSNAGGRP